MAAKRYEVRLDAPDGENFRVMTVLAEDEKDARKQCNRREAARVAYQEPDFEQRRDAGELDATHIQIHEQDEPYRVRSVKEV